MVFVWSTYSRDEFKRALRNILEYINIRVFFHLLLIRFAQSKYIDFAVVLENTVCVIADHV